MSTEPSVTRWLDQLKAGDSVAAQPLWERYFQRLTDLARRRLAGVPRGMADEEDVAIAAFTSFYRGVTAGRFPQLEDRDDLWKVLVVLTARKAGALRTHEGRVKRGGPEGPALQLEEGDWERIIGGEPTPYFAAEVAEQYRLLFDRLGDDTLRAVALRKMEGHTNEEIAGQLGCNLRTVERKVRVIRSIWEAEGASLQPRPAAPPPRFD